ncbi:hypothetical protein [Roseivirga sp. E12]|uniref:hypothetical protein n=1 Tax=Roseivirga sp. E12 TaxID=2819237 RepID=UPI001ABC2A5F|nr:hypothetical protein [Roseivirga sp. E12]MBO3698694.1 hypothetical protein [Roseivirga sp. E12]
MIKISIILSFLAFSCVVQAQGKTPFLDQKVSYELTDQPIVEILKTLEANHKGLVFVYSSSTFDMQRKVSGHFQEVTLSDLLKEVFKEEYVDFQEKSSKIIIKPKKKPKESSTTQKKVAQDTSKKETKLRRRARVVSRPVSQKKIEASTEDIESPVSYPVKLEIEKEADTISEESKSQTPKIHFDLVSLENNKSLTFNRTKLVYPHMSYTNTLIDSSLLESKAYKRAILKEEKEKKRQERQQERLNEEKKFRAYITSYTGYTQVGGNGGIQMGGSLVWLKNKRWGFGLSGYAVQRAVDSDMVLSGDYRLAGGYGGVFVEYTPRPSDKFHLSFPLLIGGGGLAYLQQIDRSVSVTDPLVEDSHAFAVIEPGVTFEANLLKFLRVGMSVSYRYTTNTALNYQSNSDQIVNGTAINSLSFGVSVKAGIF